jgi:hypothetical protein
LTFSPQAHFWVNRITVSVHQWLSDVSGIDEAQGAPLAGHRIVGGAGACCGSGATLHICAAVCTRVHGKATKPGLHCDSALMLVFRNFCLQGLRGKFLPIRGPSNTGIARCLNVVQQLQILENTLSSYGLHPGPCLLCLLVWVLSGRSCS